MQTNHENTHGHIHTSYNNVLKLPPGIELSKPRYSSPLALLILPQGHIHSPTTHKMALHIAYPEHRVWRAEYHNSPLTQTI